jgi:endonuclease/exonuclease/phosphatase family metal-dependent hydrolase
VAVRVRVLKRFTLNGTIDGHDPIGVVLRITGGLRPFRLVVVSANLGRDYSPRQFRRNVMRILDKVDERQYVVLLLQEIDEADPVEEHEKLLRWLEPDTTLVGWTTREPIAVSPGVRVKRKRRTLLMEQGTKIGAPEGTGPRRDLVSCVLVIEGVEIGVANQHPHRNLPHPRVQHARRRGERVTSRVLTELAELCDLVVDGGDFNDTSPPKAHPRQRTLISRRLDHIRLIVP